MNKQDIASALTRFEIAQEQIVRAQIGARVALTDAQVEALHTAVSALEDVQRALRKALRG